MVKLSKYIQKRLPGLMSHDFEDSAAEVRTKTLKKYKLSLLVYYLHIINVLVSRTK